MKKGICLILHKIGKSKVKRKNIKLWLDGSVIKWETRGVVMNTKGSIQLTIIRNILWGKEAAIFKREENNSLKSSCCFSLVTRDYTIDFECANGKFLFHPTPHNFCGYFLILCAYRSTLLVLTYLELERNAVARGFSILIAHVKGKLIPATLDNEEESGIVGCDNNEHEGRR